MKETAEPTLGEIKEELKLNRLMILELFGVVNDLHFSLVPYHDHVAVGHIHRRLFKHSGLTLQDIKKVFGGLHQDYVNEWKEQFEHEQENGADTTVSARIIQKSEFNQVMDPLSALLTI